MNRRWMLLFSIVTLGLPGLLEADAQPTGQEAFERALKQCQGAVTAEQCKQALPACEQAQRLLIKLAPGEQRDDKEDGLLGTWAECEDTLGLYPEAEKHLRRLLALHKRRYGREHVQVAQSLNNLAVVLGSQRHVAEAEALHREALAVRQKLLGPEHPDIALSLNNLADVLSGQGRYAEAETLHRKALALFQKLLGPDHANVATSVSNLASALDSQGKYAEAETLHRKALALRQKLLGPEHPDVAQSLNNLASVLSGQGRYAESEMLFQKALTLYQKLLGPEHPMVAGSLNNLATVLASQGRHAEVEPLHRKALALYQKMLGPEHPNVALSLNNLADTLSSRGKYAEAETLHRKALALRQKLLGPEHPDVASSLNNLGTVLERMGKVAEAETLYLKALALYQKRLGPEHPDVAESINNLASFHLGLGKLAQVVPLWRQATTIRETQLRTTVSETRMQALLDTLRGEEDAIYGLLLSPDLPGAKELALQVTLLRKGRVAAAGTAANLIVQRSLGRPEISQQFQEWQSVRRQHEALLYGRMSALPPATYRQRLEETKLQADALEAQLASALPEIRALQPPKMETIIAEVAAKLPAGSALVEVVWTQPFQGKASADGRKWGTPHYVALILFPDRRIETVDLGEAATVDTLGLELRTVLTSPGTNPVPAAKRLYGQVMGRLQAQLGPVRDLYLSLDGTLNAVPFDALHDGTDYLLGRYRFHYLTSGRDLLRERSSREAGAPLLLANPVFGQEEAAAGSKPENSLYQRLAGLPALPGTLREAGAIAKLLGIEPLVGSRAREEAVRGRAAPRILHIATHGLFLHDVELAPPLTQSGEVRGLSALHRERSKPVGVAEAERLPGALGAMNRSALVLADAVRGASAKDTATDGLLTADEARSLDLDGTQLVVLSACETGRGGLSTGQGVYGLRRAFLVAGAETLVTSLWRVNDAATGELMTAYYQKLLDKKQPGDRLGAMVEAMQELRAKPGRSHPYYWAPFLVIGSDGPLRNVAPAALH